MNNMITYSSLEKANMWIKLRKKTLLPIKWMFTRYFEKKKVRKMEMRPKDELHDMIAQKGREKLKFERLNRKEDVGKCEGFIEAINWVLCQKEKD